MKVMSVEVVSQLALDTISRAPMNEKLFRHLNEQVQEELEHLNKCRMFLATRNSFGERPDYVDNFARVMRRCGGKRARTLPIAAVVILCIAVESSALRQLAATSFPDHELHALLLQLSADEENHYRFVANVVAPYAAANASLLERARAHMMMIRVAAITLRKWWPRQVSNYKGAGLHVEVFLSEVMGMEEDTDRLSQIRYTLQKGVDLTAKAQSGLGGWLYTPDMNGDEGSVTVTQVQGLRSAKNAGIAVPKAVIEQDAHIDIALVAYGSSDGAVREALDVLADHGVKTNYMRLRAFPFGEEVEKFLAEQKLVFVIEQNRDGQMRSLLTLETRVEKAKLRSLLHYSGLPISSEFIVKGVLAEIEPKTRKPEVVPVVGAKAKGGVA